MNSETEAECRGVVLGYATAKNEWDIQSYILDRVNDGKHVAPSRAALVEGMSEADLKQKHIQMFALYIYPRERKYGTSPGGPAMVTRDGPFSNVSPDTICSVTERNRNTIEVVTEWPYLSTEGRTMFVLKKKTDRWLIDSLKTSKYGSDWEQAHL